VDPVGSWLMRQCVHGGPGKQQQGGGLPNISFIIRKPEPLGKNKLLQIITTK
jgi:hypothetical protein